MSVSSNVGITLLHLDMAIAGQETPHAGALARNSSICCVLIQIPHSLGHVNMEAECSRFVTDIYAANDALLLFPLLPLLRPGTTMFEV